jgi:hypothetical protein
MPALVTWICWGLVAAVWIVGAFSNRGRVPSIRQPSSGRIAWFAVVVAAWLIFKATRADLHVITTHAWWVEAPGLVVLLVSAVFTLWGRFALGAMCSRSTISCAPPGHMPSLGTRSTPAFCMLLGTALLNGLGGWIAAPLLGVLFVAARVHAEEQVMTQAFPGDYQRYRQRVPQLIPGLWVLKRAGRGDKG